MKNSNLYGYCYENFFNPKLTPELIFANLKKFMKNETIADEELARLRCQDLA
jgi:hypothetical protein